MQRTVVQITRMRISDLRAGDVANTDPDATRGWFIVDTVRELTNGEFAVSNASERKSINGAGDDIVGLQIHKTVEIASAPAAAA